MSARHAIAASMLASGLGACGVAGDLPTTTLYVDGHPVVAEVASSASARSRGLMHRTRLGEDEGMWFVYAHEVELSFWMKNTFIPLSIAFVRSDGEIVRIADLDPLSLTGVPSGEPVQYALEMNQGWFAAHDVEVGDYIQ